MDLLKKIENIKNSVDKLEYLTDDLNESVLVKQIKIKHLKEEIKINVEKIDNILKNYNAKT